MKVQRLEIYLKTLLRPHLCAFILRLKETLRQLCKRITNNIVTQTRLIVFQPRPERVPTFAQSLRRTRQELLGAHNYFNSVSDNNLVDCAIYQMMALEKQYSYYLKKARTERKIMITPPYQFKKVIS